MSNGANGAFVCLVILDRWHERHDRAKDLMTEAMDRQTKRRRKSWRSGLPPAWAKSWAADITRRVRDAGTTGRGGEGAWDVSQSKVTPPGKLQRSSTKAEDLSLM